MNKIVTFIFFTLIVLINIKAQDTIVSTDNTILVGEIKDMDKGVLSIETDFSDSDFKISWLKIKEIRSQRNFRFILSNQKRYYGTISMDSINIIIHDETGNIKVSVKDLVYIKQVDKGSILDIINLSMDLGYSYTNANNLEQINGSINVDYYTNVWGVLGYFNTVQSTQTNVEPIKRNNGGIGTKIFAKYGLFGTIDADFYTNNEQNMDLRSNYHQ